MDIHVLPVAWDDRREELQKIRQEVFIEEQQVPREIEWDGEDEHSQHFIALTSTGVAVGCARLLPNHQIGRMAVLKEFRSLGIGNRLLELAVEFAMHHGIKEVHLHAQKYAEDFYRKAGFVPMGESFEEAGIEHIAMSRPLAIPFEVPEELPAITAAAVPPPVVSISQPVNLPEDLSARQFAEEQDCLGALSEGVTLATRKLFLFSPMLDHALFDQLTFVEAVSEFARNNYQAKLSILLLNNRLAVSRGHRLVELARRLSSKIEIRCVPEQLATDKHSCLVWDDTGFWLLPDSDAYVGFAQPYDPVQAARLADRFKYLWDRSHSDPELRTLKI